MRIHNQLTMSSLRDNRKHMGFSQVDLSNLTGISQDNISRIERGLYKTTQSTRQKIEAVVGKIDWIEVEGIKLHDSNFYKAERLLKRLIEASLVMNPKEKIILQKMIRKYFINK